MNGGINPKVMLVCELITLTKTASIKGGAGAKAMMVPPLDRLNTEPMPEKHHYEGMETRRVAQVAKSLHLYLTIHKLTGMEFLLTKHGKTSSTSYRGRNSRFLESH